MNLKNLGIAGIVLAVLLWISNLVSIYIGIFNGISDEWFNANCVNFFVAIGLFGGGAALYDTNR